MRTYIIKEVGEPYDTKKITTPKAGFKLFKKIFKNLDDDREHFVVFYLDNSFKTSYYKIIASGTLEFSEIDIRAFIRYALLTNCRAVIMAHNHPSGELDPSPDDIKLTKKLIKACKIFDIALLDHLIINKRKFISLKSEKYI